MVSRRTPSPTSSYSSCCDSWHDGDCLSVDKERDRDVERLPDDDDREVARRVLEDLESIYFGGNDEESEEDYGSESSSEGGSDVSQNSRGRRRVGGMTQEELTMVVNATIEYHRPTQQKVVESPVKLSKHKKNDKLIQHLGEPNPYHHRCNQRSNSLVRSDESVLEMFQHMLERKEKHFYALRATEIAVNDEVRDNQNQETATSRVATANQHQQTTSYLRDQTPDTENLSHQPMVNESTQFSEFNTSVHSLPPAVSPYELMEPIAGPTLADLASHRKRERYPSSFQSYPSSIASRSSSSPSSATDQVNSHFQSSYSSKYSSSNNFSSHSIMSSAKSGAYSRHCSHTSKRSYRCNGTSSTVSSLSRSSKHSSHRNVSPASSIETTLPDNCDFTLSKKDELLEVSQVAVAPPISDSQVSSRAELVTWELDLSNFAF